jgi:hypothetical protein
LESFIGATIFLGCFITGTQSASDKRIKRGHICPHVSSPLLATLIKFDGRVMNTFLCDSNILLFISAITAAQDGEHVRRKTF